ncbi:hypothetical protein EK21DRAFT_93669 [Setomelanomma holmii]|uniref:Zn(2)-C6 fungal-type domain-containing protein n=1 Tax=Setomelanomma holmii TaxID=210430 RepID=A0A9P4LI93_9PLEO|nr:hypothetical protein EK21DRAFT_93669 [Setomelanomma holmii]
MPSPESTTNHARPAPLACLECRRTHLKCDGVQPTCARCNGRGYACTYTRSGRGRRRGVTRSDTAPQTTVAQVPFDPAAPSQWFPDSAASLKSGTSVGEASRSIKDAPLVGQLATPVMTAGSTTDSLSGRLPLWVDDEQHVNLYYLNFHPSHPILLPRSMYWKQSYPRYLRAVVQLIGGHFAPAASKDGLRERAAQELQEGEQSGPEMVQARILYSIALFAQNDSREGQRILDSAIESALKLGMHRREFAASNSNGLTQLEESMRRTWYELYVTDGCVAALQRKSAFMTNTVNADVLLPCDDFIYEGGMCFMPATLDEFHCNVFADEEKVFSSFCYRIEAVRLLGRVLTITGAHGVHRDLVQAVDNALAAFIHHLPRAKSEAEIVNTFGELDELMFQAHTIVQYSTILLHFPRGDLVCPDPLTKEVPGGNNTRLLCPCNRQHVHSIKAIEASKTISMLAALRTPVQRHGPFLVYPIALAAVVQLSISAIHVKTSSGCMEQHSDRVKLMLGVLKALGRHWESADFVLRTLKKAASAVFRSPRLEPSYALQQDDPMDSGIETCPHISMEQDWLDHFDLQDLNGLVGLDNSAFRI